MPKRHRRKYQPKRRTDRTHPREIRQRFLIVCEGKETESNYFKAFRVPGDVKINIKGIGYNTVSLIRKTIELQNRDGKYDQVWCVFDKDDFSAQSFNDALSLAKHNGIKVAYSNEAFELWYLLHFDYIDTGLSRHSYKKRLTERLGFTYKKNDPNIYAKLESRQENAIKNAERLLASYGDDYKPVRGNPSTTIHQLVKELNKFAV